MIRARPSSRRDRGAAPVVVVALGVLTLALLLVVASSGVVSVWTEPPPVLDRGPAAAVEPGDPPEPVEFEAQPFDRDLEPPDTWWWDVIAVLILLGLLRIAWIVVSVYWQLFQGWWEGRSKRERGFSPLPDSNGGTDGEVSFDLDAGLGELQRGAPRNAIVACWSRLEDDVAAAGLPRVPSETSVEYTERVLATASVDADAIRELAELYRVARFSEHPVDEVGRTRAVDALRRVHASLRVREPGGVA